MSGSRSGRTETLASDTALANSLMNRLPGRLLAGRPSGPDPPPPRELTPELHPSVLVGQACRHGPVPGHSQDQLPRYRRALVAGQALLLQKVVKQLPLGLVLGEHADAREGVAGLKAGVSQKVWSGGGCHSRAVANAG